MLRPAIFETVEEVREMELNFIRTCRKLKESMEKALIDHPAMPEDLQKMTRASIRTQQQLIRQGYSDIVEMQRWWLKEGKNRGK